MFDELIQKNDVFFFNFICFAINIFTLCLNLPVHREEHLERN